jgi:uncharacterized protein (DUF1499 family)
MRKIGAFVLGFSGCLALAAFVTGPILAYTGKVAPLAGFGVYAAGSVLGVITSVASMIVYLRKGRGWGPALGLLGVPAALALVYTVVSTFGIPPINDISTDVTFPPAFFDADTPPRHDEQDIAFPTTNAKIIEEFYTDVRPLPLTRSMDDVMVQVTKLAQSEPGWTIVNTRVGPEEVLIQGTASSKVFHFVDDFVVRITRESHGGSVVDMRSKSRDGKSDLGVNAQRIENFLGQLQAAPPG